MWLKCYCERDTAYCLPCEEAIHRAEKLAWADESAHPETEAHELLNALWGGYEIANDEEEKWPWE